MRVGIHRAEGSSAPPPLHTDKKQLLLISSHLISHLLFVFHFTFIIRVRGDRREPAEVRPPRTAPLGSEGMTASLQHRDPVAAVPPHPLISSPPLGSELPESDPATLRIHSSSVAPTLFAMLPPQTARFTSFPQRERCVVMAVKISEVCGGF